MSPVNVAVVGVGNCAAALIQGVDYYADNAHGSLGLTNPTCGGYTVADIRFSAAFDVDVSKVGRDLSEAIWIKPNNALKFADVPHLGVAVDDGILADGLGRGLAERIPARGEASVERVAERLRETQTDVVVNLIPTGGQRASELYAEAALHAGCAFVNCIPSTIARSVEWADKFRAAGLPLTGDDLKSQFGSTLVHRALMELLANNGVEVRTTYQIVGGGNMDFLNLVDPERVASKRETKVQGFSGPGERPTGEHFGAEFISFLGDRKTAFMRLDGEAFGGTSFELELRMSVEDSPSAAGNILDAVRYMKLALDRGIGGVVDPVSLQLMKAPPAPSAVEEALNWKGFPAR